MVNILSQALTVDNHDLVTYMWELETNYDSWKTAWAVLPGRDRRIGGSGGAPTPMR